MYFFINFEMSILRYLPPSQRVPSIPLCRHRGLSNFCAYGSLWILKLFKYLDPGAASGHLKPRHTLQSEATELAHGTLLAGAAQPLRPSLGPPSILRSNPKQLISFYYHLEPLRDPYPSLETPRAPFIHPGVVDFPPSQPVELLTILRPSQSGAAEPPPCF